MASLISVGQIIDTSLDHYRKHFKELLAITLWVVVASLPSIVGQLLAPTGQGAAVTAGDWFTFGLSFLGTVLVSVVSIWMYATLILAIDEQADGKIIDVKKVGRAGWRSFWRYVGLTLLLALIFLGIALIALPGLMLMLLGGLDGTGTGLMATMGTPLFLIGAAVSTFLLAKAGIELAFAPFILLIEGKGVFESIKTSSALVRGRWWATLLRFAVPKFVYFLIIFIVSLLLFTALQILIIFASTTFPLLALFVFAIRLLLASLLPAITTPLIIATDYYLYDSLRATK